MADWYTLEEARNDWAGAPMDDAQLQAVLDVSQYECLTFASVPTYDPLAPVIPDGHRWAHLQHAKNIWNAQKVNPSGQLGDDTQGFALTPWPLEWSIKQRLRPRVIFGGSVG